MGDRSNVLRLYLLDERREVDADRATLIVDRLADLRELEGGVPEWWISYEIEDPSLAMDTCARDLDALDSAWLEILDFSLVRRPVTSHWAR